LLAGNGFADGFDGLESVITVLVEAGLLLPLVVPALSSVLFRLLNTPPIDLPAPFAPAAAVEAPAVAAECSTIVCPQAMAQKTPIEKYQILMKRLRRQC
jgi:hypothetical protein